MNYIGSKYSLLGFLESAVDAVANNARCGVFADLFAGTGVVGEAFKKKGYTVIANDIQYYSYVLNRHYVENTPPVAANRLAYLNQLEGIDGFVYKNYCAGGGGGRNYFTDENGRKCDAIRSALNNMSEAGEIGNDEYFYYLSGLINSIDKVANTASVYGAYLKHIKASAAKPLTLELLPLVPGNRGKAHNEDISELILKISGDVLYLDPPYNARQYSANYHVLETISKYDSPNLCGVTGLRSSNADGRKSAFCSKRTVGAAFENIIKNARFKYIFLSYNNEGLMPIETIRDIMSKYGKYDVFTTNYKRFRADKKNAGNRKSNATTEYLHICVK